MKIISTLLLVLFITSCASQKNTEIIVIGNIHQAVPNYNSDTLFAILEKVKPDFILNELDSTFFTSDFRFKEKQTENEAIASVKYTNKYPNTKIRPFDFEGRNEHRKQIGSRPTDGLAIKLIDSLYTEKLLTPEQANIYKKYIDLLEPLKVAAAQSPDNFNNSNTDSISKERQNYQYKMLLKIANERDEFINHFYTKPNGEKISYRKGLQLASDFWDLRNQTMAKKILKIADANKGKRIVVLTGFLHRYYILSELKRLTDNQNISIKEFYEY